MDQMLESFPFEIFFQLLFATLLGGLVGLEREMRHKQAGMRTYALVSLGAALFVVVAVNVMEHSMALGITNFDPTRMIQAVAMGIGFLGAGIIIFRDSHVEGATTAAGVWVAAAIGATIGFQLYLIATMASLFAVLVLAGLRLIEARWLGKEGEGEKKEL